MQPSSEPSFPVRVRGALLLGLGIVLANAGYLHWLWKYFDHWGIWDWDLQLALFESARRSLVVHGQLPLWNPWLGGGTSLVGHPLGNSYSPSFLLPLVLGTIPGVKLTILLYLSVAQVGVYLLARRLSLDTLPAALSALLFSWGGVFAQHLTHGHIGWIGYGWVPFTLVALHGMTHRIDAKNVGAAAFFLALAWLDGGPYHYVYVPLFVSLYAAALALRERTLRPLLALPLLGAFAIAIAAIEVVPVAEMIREYPRKTIAASDFYGVPFEPTAAGLLYDAFLSRAQAHDPDLWMPYVVNVGAYVGLLPVLLAAVGLVGRLRTAWPVALLLVVVLLICLHGTLPIDPWQWLHRLPGFDSMKVPMRFRIFALLCLALLAGFGLETLIGLFPRIAPWIAGGVLAFVGVDLFLVNAPVYEAGFSIPPIQVKEREFRQHRNSPYRSKYMRTARVPLWRNWPSASLPTVMQNVGVIQDFLPTSWPAHALHFRHRNYPGSEVVALAAEAEVVEFELTPNRIRFTKTGVGGLVVINQNYLHGWTVAEGRAGEPMAHEGLLAVPVPAGEHSVTLTYRPLAFMIAAPVSALALAALLVITLRGRKRVGPPPSSSPGARAHQARVAE